MPKFCSRSATEPISAGHKLAIDSIRAGQPVIKYGSDALKESTLPRVATGDLHVCFGVTEPGAGLDTSRITTFAKREGDHYRINGRKVWISKALESEKILLLTRTTPYDDVKKKTDGMTLFLTACVDLGTDLARRFVLLALLFAVPGLLFGWVEDVRVFLPCAVMMCFAVAAHKEA